MGLTFLDYLVFFAFVGGVVIFGCSFFRRSRSGASAFTKAAVSQARNFSDCLILLDPGRDGAGNTVERMGFRFYKTNPEVKVTAIADSEIKSLKAALYSCGSR